VVRLGLCYSRAWFRCGLCCIIGRRGLDLIYVVVERRGLDLAYIVVERRGLDLVYVV